ncbi:MAG: polymerase, sigma-24 subunit, subfamily [Herbinix sp.]|jgi:RNA polymerase sigma factor (sigma-70 family)|nr:polymerase, sigma-24 subunit, subfamily [Herbinix sp.]
MLEIDNLDDKMASISRSVLSYCIARTSNQHDAEDLAQDIIVELIKSVTNIRDEKAFYGFMWAVAGNVYAAWYRKRSKRRNCELTEDIFDEVDCFENINNRNDELYVLRRELSLLTEKYRKAVILYYLENKSCIEISSLLGISESMVKYLLFKARKILKEGMDMERSYGEQSYNPKTLELMYMGEGPNQFWKITNDKKIPQNILFACYNDSLTEEEISLQIGVALPYLEKEISTLLKAGLIIKNGYKYSTNIIIFTKEFKNELDSKIMKRQEDIADKLYRYISDNEEKIRSIGFHLSDMSRNSFYWHITCVTMNYLFGKITEKFTPWESPVTAFGEKAYVWGDESPRGVLNTCNMSKYDECLIEGELHFLDYLPHIKSDSNVFYRNLKLANFLVKLASNKVHNFNEYEKEFMAELIEKGYAINENGSVSLSLPVYSQSQIKDLFSILDPIIYVFLDIASEIMKIIEKVLKNHTPTHLKQQITSIACMRMFDDIICATIENMRDKDYLKVNWNANEMPTVYLVLEE